MPYMTLEYVIKKNGMNPSTDMVLDDSIKFDLMYRKALEIVTHNEVKKTTKKEEKN